MSLESDLETLMSRSYLPSQMCAVSFILQSASEDQCVLITTLIDHSTVPASQIAHVLNNHGFKISDTSISRHRRRIHSVGCACPR